MSVNAAAATVPAPGRIAGRIEICGDAGGIWLHEPAPEAARELARADDVFPFTPDTFLDELVGVCVSDESGAGLTADRFRALPPATKSIIVAALLRHQAEGSVEAALPRGPNESDAAFLLRAWRLAREQTPSAEQTPFHARGDVPANDAAPGLIAAVAPSTSVPVADAQIPEAATDENPAAPAIATPARPRPAVVMPPARRPGSRAALMLATMACLLAVATLGVSMAMLLRQDGVDQTMMRDLRRQQDQMMAATRADQAAIAALTAQVQALHPAAAAPASSSGDEAAPQRSHLRTTSLQARARAALPPIWPDHLRMRQADEFP